MIHIIAKIMITTMMVSGPMSTPTATPSEPPTPAQNPDPALISAAAAQQAASAAQTAAEAAQRAAQAIERLTNHNSTDDSSPAASVPLPPLPSSWTGSLGIGLIALTGNARTVTTNGAVAAELKTAKWIVSVKANGAYGQNRPLETDISEVVAQNASVQIRGDRRFTSRYSGFLTAGLDADHVNSIEARPYGETGVSFLWLDETVNGFSRLKLSTDLAFRYGREVRFQYYPTPSELPDNTIAAPRVGAAFRYGLNKDVIFTEEVEVLSTISGPSRILANSSSKISARLTSPLSLGIAFLVKHDSAPAPGKVATDTAMTVGIEAGF